MLYSWGTWPCALGFTKTREGGTFFPAGNRGAGRLMSMAAVFLRPGPHPFQLLASGVCRPLLAESSPSDL